MRTLVVAPTKALLLQAFERFKSELSDSGFKANKTAMTLMNEIGDRVMFCRLKNAQDVEKIEGFVYDGINQAHRCDSSLVRAISPWICK